MKTWTVYKHVSPSGKVYVGISSNIDRRWAAHGLYYCHKETIFSKAILKYGWENFEHIVISSGLTKEEACSKEKELIAYYKELGISYNITDGGEGYSGKHSSEHIKHRVESRVSNSSVDYIIIDKDFNYIICNTTTEAASYLGVKQGVISHVLLQPIGYTCKKHYLWKHKKGTPVDLVSIKRAVTSALTVRREKQVADAKSKKDILVAASKKERESLTKEQRKRRYSNFGMLGKKHSEKTKLRIGAANKGKKPASSTIQASIERNSIPIEAFYNGSWILYPSARDAERDLHIEHSHIAAVCKGKRKTAGGLRFRYYES